MPLNIDIAFKWGSKKPADPNPPPPPTSTTSTCSTMTTTQSELTEEKLGTVPSERSENTDATQRSLKSTPSTHSLTGDEGSSVGGTQTTHSVTGGDTDTQRSRVLSCTQIESAETQPDSHTHSVTPTPSEDTCGSRGSEREVVSLQSSRQRRRPRRRTPRPKDPEKLEFLSPTHSLRSLRSRRSTGSECSKTASATGSSTQTSTSHPFSPFCLTVDESSVEPSAIPTSHTSQPQSASRRTKPRPPAPPKSDTRDDTLEDVLFEDICSFSSLDSISSHSSCSSVRPVVLELESKVEPVGVVRRRSRSAPPRAQCLSLRDRRRSAAEASEDSSRSTPSASQQHKGASGGAKKKSAEATQSESEEEESDASSAVDSSADKTKVSLEAAKSKEASKVVPKRVSPKKEPPAAPKEHVPRIFQQAMGTRRVILFRHAERLDRVFPSWTREASVNGLYRPYNANQPPKLPKRRGGLSAFRHDPPITPVGRLVAQLAARALRQSQISVSALYASPALRCLETAQVLAKEGGTPDARIRLEPGLFDWFSFYESVPALLTHVEAQDAGLPLARGYKPIVPRESLVRTFGGETKHDFYRRAEEVIHKILATTTGTVVLVGHATTLDATARCLLELPKSIPASHHLDRLADRYPYCSAIVLEQARDNGQWRVGKNLAPLTFLNQSTAFDKTFLLRK